MQQLDQWILEHNQEYAKRCQGPTTNLILDWQPTLVECKRRDRRIALLLLMGIQFECDMPILEALWCCTHFHSEMPKSSTVLEFRNEYPHRPRYWV
jgi:hypothetical protein